MQGVGIIATERTYVMTYNGAREMIRCVNTATIGCWPI